MARIKERGKPAPKPAPKPAARPAPAPAKPAARPAPAPAKPAPKPAAPPPKAAPAPAKPAPKVIPEEKAVVKRAAQEEEKALAAIPPAALPAYLEGKEAEVLDVEPGEVAFPLIKLLQSKSSQVEREDPIGKAGDFFNTATEEDLGDAIVFVPMVLVRKRIFWRDMNEGGGIICRSYDNKSGNVYGECAKCIDEDTNIPRASFGPDGSHPLCTKYYDFCSLILGDVSVDPDSRIIELDSELDFNSAMAVVSMSTTKLKAAKRIIQVVQAKRVPLYANVFQMTRKLVDNNGNRYYVPEVEWVGWCPEELFSVLEEQIGSIMAIMKPGESYEDESPAEVIGEEVVAGEGAANGEGAAAEADSDLPF